MGSQHRLRLLAGASAGSINSLLTLVSVYGVTGHQRPEDSLDWRVWIPLAEQSLYRPQATGPVNLLSRDALEKVADMVWQAWKLGLSTDCDVVWAVPTTRLHPRLVWFATLAETLEGGLSWLLPVPTNRSWRLNVAVLVDGVGRLITSNSGKLAVGAGVGPEWNPHTLSSSLLQTRLFLRGGYLLGQGDRFASRPCAQPHTEQLGNCSRLVVQGGVGVTVLDNLRVQVMGTWYPPVRATEKNLWEVTPGVGVQF